MAREQDVVKLPFKLTEFTEDIIPLLNRNFAEIERMLSLLQGYVKQSTGGAVKDLPTKAGVWDRASNINPDGTFPANQLTDTLVGLTHDLQLANAAVTAAKIAVAAVTTNAIADNAVDGAKIANAAITAVKLADQAVTNYKIADGAVDIAKFASGLRPVEIVSSLPALPDASYPQGAVVFLTTDNKLYRSDGNNWTAAVPTSDLTGTITETQITDGAVSTPKLAAGAVTTGKIAAGAVTANEIAANTITSGEIAAGAVTAAAIAAGAVGAAAIAAGAVTADKIAALAVTAGKIAAGAVTANEIAAGSITTDHISADGISANKIIKTVNARSFYQ